MKKIILILLSLLILFETSAEIIPFEINNKIGFIGSDGKVIFTPQFTEISEINKKIALVKSSDIQKYERYLIFESGEKIKIDLTQIDVNLIDDDLFAVGGKHSRLFESYIYDADANLKLKLHNLEIQPKCSSEHIVTVNPYNEEKPRFDIINVSGEEIPADYSQFMRIHFCNDSIAVVQDTEFDFRIYYFKKKDFIPQKWHILQKFSDGLAFGISDSFDQYGYFNAEGKLVIETKRIEEDDFAPKFNSGVIPCILEGNSYQLLPKESNSWCIIDKNGKVQGEKFSAVEVSNFNKSGYAIIVQKNGNGKEYNLINRKGKKMLKNSFDEIKSDINGYYRASLNGVDYLINSKTLKLIKCSKLK